MLIYGSLRKNVYLFSVINTLINLNQGQDTRPRTEDSKNNETAVSTNRPNFLQRLNRTKKDRKRNRTNMANTQQNPEVSPIIAKRQK